METLYVLSVVINQIWLFFVVQIYNSATSHKLKKVIEENSDILIDDDTTAAPSIFDAV